MSFSNRLTTFFILMVLVPILGIGVLGFRLIDATSSGRAGARASGLVTAASGVYTADEDSARSAAKAVGEAIERLPAGQVTPRISEVARAAGLVRVSVVRNGRTIADIGNRAAVAPGTAVVQAGAVTWRVTASTSTAREFATAVTGPLSAAVLTQRGHVLASTLGQTLSSAPPPTRVTAHGQRYTTDSYSGLSGFGGAPVTLTMLSNRRASDNSESASDLIAVGFLAGLALLAFGFAVLASRGLNEMVKRFLAAATRLADRDFSARVPIEGNDEFARLATEFNRMSDQLEHYIGELDAERVRLRDAIRRTGETFEASLDKEQLEALTLSTALGGSGASFGRMTWRADDDAPLRVVQATGAWNGAGELILSAERHVLNEAPFSEADAGEVHVMAARMGVTPHRKLAYGTLTVGRHGDPFSNDDRDLFRSLAVQAWRALDNVRLHDEADRKATTDPLTGLANHGQFQIVLGHEMEDVRRYHYPVGLILIDLDDFKQVNDTYGHPQGDAVLRGVAHVLAQSTREGDTAARYGGEEMALILPHTDLDGAYAIAERIRNKITQLTTPRVDGNGELKVTASVGVSATVAGEKDELVAEADTALYQAKRSGKNRVIRAGGARAR
jgi:diguanylate cyclase (GGDEF)-like protein